MNRADVMRASMLLLALRDLWHMRKGRGILGLIVLLRKFTSQWPAGIVAGREASADAGDRGPIDTPMLQNSNVATASASPSVDGMKLAIDRRGTPEEVAKLIAFLLSDESSYTTGSCYTIDGGYMA